MKRILLTAVLLLIAMSAAAQRRQIDSLKAVLSTARDTMRVKALYQLCFYYGQDSRPDSALQYGKDAIRLAEQQGYTRGLATAYRTLGFMYYARGDFFMAATYLKESLPLWKKLGDDRMYGGASDLVGQAYARLGQYPQALEYSYQALQVIQKLGDKQQEANIINTLAVIYYEENNYFKALELNFKAMGIRRSLNDERGIADSYMNLGNVYQDRHQNVMAAQHYEEALVRYTRMGYKGGMADCYNNLGLAYLELKNYEQALGYFRKFLDLGKELNNLPSVILANANLAEVYSKMGRHTEAETHLVEAERLLEQVKDPKLSTAVLIKSSYVYERAGKFPLAIKALRAYVTQVDSSYQKERSAQIYELQARYETQQKEQKIRDLEHQSELDETRSGAFRIFIFLTVGLLVVMLGVGFYFYRRMRLRM